MNLLIHIFFFFFFFFFFFSLWVGPLLGWVVRVVELFLVRLTDSSFCQFVDESISRLIITHTHY